MRDQARLSQHVHGFEQVPGLAQVTMVETLVSL